MQDFLNYILFSFNAQDITVANVLLATALVSLLVFVYRKIDKLFIPHLFEKVELDPKTKKEFYGILRWFMIFLLIYTVITSLSIDYVLFKAPGQDVSICNIFLLLLVWQLVRAFDWIVNNVYLDYFYPKDNPKYSELLIKPPTKRRKRNLLQRIFSIYLILLILQTFNLDFEMFNFSIGTGEASETVKAAKEQGFYFSFIFQVIMTIFIAQVIIWSIIHLLLLKIYENRNLELGSQFAINQLVKYVIYTFTVIYCFKIVGIDMTIILGGAAALLVGVGLGLQQTFNDFISGIVLLFERSVSVGDVLEFDNTVGVVDKIGLRSSTVHTRDNVSMIVPNHLLINERVTNWTNLSDNIRFAVQLSVAYGSDTEKVKRLLIEAAREQEKVLQFPEPFVRFNSFGDSSLNFTVYFFSKEYLIIEDIKSDIRLNIDRLFRENNISIPFPQREVRILNKDQ